MTDPRRQIFTLNQKDSVREIVNYLRLRDEMLGTSEANDNERTQSAKDILELVLKTAQSNPERIVHKHLNIRTQRNARL